MLTFLYSLGVKIRNFLYDQNILRSKKIDRVKIICIGNILMGGTGKTPLVQYYINEYNKTGKKLAIVLRGYGGKRKKDPLIVSDGKNILCSLEECGEEAYFHAQKANVPVIVSKKRYKGALLAKKKFDAKIILLDDGFQHRSLFRDENILVVDATNPFGNYKLLPAGELREPLKSIQRATKIVITKSNLINKLDLQHLKNKLEIYKKKIKVSYFESNLVDFYNNPFTEEQLAGKKSLGIAGIGNFVSFHKTILLLTDSQVEILEFSDHHKYTNRDMKRIYDLYAKNNIDYIITTEKDMVKLSVLIQKEHEKRWLVVALEYKMISK